MRVVFDWGVSSFFGWGVYGLNLALEWSLDPDIELYASMQIAAKEVQVDLLRRRALRPFVKRSARPAPADAIGLYSLGNDLVSGVGADLDADKRPHRVGVCFFEEPLTPAAKERAKRFDLIVAGSSWNEQLLRDAGIDHVKTILQGVDPTLFHPGPRRGLFPGKFVIFSGGKAERRKGQDIVVAAFRIFAREHPEAMLVTAWHSPWDQLRTGMDLDLSEFGDRVVDVGAVPNALMPQIYRECDVAVFPNRAEGGTNLVAMECIACGVPTFLSQDTGHMDLISRSYGVGMVGELTGELVADFFGAVRPDVSFWAVPPLHKDLTWSRTAAALKSTLEGLYGRCSDGGEQAA